MNRVDIGGWCTLYHADATEILDVLRQHEPDAVVMDPPYGINVPNYSKGKYLGMSEVPGDLLGRGLVHGNKEGPDIRPWIEFSAQCLTWGSEHLRSQLPEAGGRWLAWDKLAGMAPFNDYGDVEFAWHSVKGPPRIISHRWKGFVADSKLEDGQRVHPMQKPVRVMQWSIMQCRLAPGAIILDPYMGSGTTGIAAFGMDMKFVGVEIEERWFDVAVKRITERCDAGLFA